MILWRINSVYAFYSYCFQLVINPEIIQGKTIELHNKDKNNLVTTICIELGPEWTVLVKLYGKTAAELMNLDTDVYTPECKLE